MPASISDTQKVLATLNFTDALGAPAMLPAGVIPAWVSDNTAVATIDNSQDPSGMTAWVVSVATGTCNVNTSTAVDPANPILASDSVGVNAGPATKASLSFGAPVSK